RSISKKESNSLKVSSTLHRIFKESVFVTFTDYLSFGVLFLITIFINKFYDTSQLGLFTLIYTIAQITVMSFGSGFSGILRRDVSIDPSLSTSYISNLLKIRGSVVLLSLFFAVIGSYFLVENKSGFIYFLFLMILAKGFDLGNETFYTTYQSIHAIRRFTFIKSANFILLGLIVGVVCINRLPVHYIYEAHALVAVSFFVFNGLFYHKKQEPIKATIFKRNTLTKYLLVETWPLLVNAVFFQLSSRISIIIIEVLNGTRMQGMYSLGITIIGGLTAFANSISIVLFPYLTVTYKNNFKRLWPNVNKVILAFLGCAILLVIAFNAALPIILQYVGHLPPEAPKVFSILSWGIIPVFLTALTGYLFTIMGKQLQGMYASGITLVINITGFYFLSRYYNIIGSAYAFILCQSISFLVMYFWAYSIIKRKRSL
ncbi:MAG: polysaccharide biosynthesis C-terminal domain-containing protein, partial [Ginsengibacter sp.]